MKNHTTSELELYTFIALNPKSYSFNIFACHYSKNEIENIQKVPDVVSRSYSWIKRLNSFFTRPNQSILNSLQLE